MKLRMRTVEHSAGPGAGGGSGSSGGDLFGASAKPDHSAWERCAPLIDDAKELFGDLLADQSATSGAAGAAGGGANRAPPPPPPGGGVRASVALLSGSSANAEGLTPMEAAELESVRAALQADLKLVASAKHYCSLAIDSAFQALKEVPCNEGRANAALAALAEVKNKSVQGRHCDEIVWWSQSKKMKQVGQKWRQLNSLLLIIELTFLCSFTCIAVTYQCSANNLYECVCLQLTRKGGHQVRASRCGRSHGA